MNTNWNWNRDFVLGRAVDLVLKGYPVESVADSMIEAYFNGVSPQRARAAFLKSLRIQVSIQQQLKCARESTELLTMADALKAEGWRFLTVPERSGGFFWHDQHGSVNNLGGPFPSWAEAVRRTYNSALRALVNE